MKKMKNDKDGLSTPENPKAQPPHGGYMHPKSERMDHEILNDKMAKGLGC